MPTSKEELRQAIVADLLELSNKAAACRAKMVLFNPLAAQTVASKYLKKVEVDTNNMAMEVNRWPL